MMPVLNKVHFRREKMKKTSKIFLIIAMVAVVASACLIFVACGESVESAKKINMVNVELSSEQYAFIFKKSDDALKASVNSILESKKNEIDQIMDKYLNATQEELSSFGDDQIATSASGSDNELVVATNVDFAPFEYYNGSKIAGIDIEIAQLIADELGKTLVIVHMDFEAVVTAVQTLDIYDIGMAALTISEDRAEVVNFSNPYYDTTQVILTKAGENTPFDYCTTVDEMKKALISLDNAKIGGQTGTTGQLYITGNDSLGFDGYSNIKFSGYDSPALAVQDMINDNIDYVIVDKAIAVTLLKNFNS